MPDLGFPPRSRSSACARTVLPAPVSPVMTLSPASRRSSARSIRSRFSTLSSVSMRAESHGDRTEKPNACSYGDLVRQAPELVPEAVVERRARDLCEQHLAVLEGDVHLPARLEVRHRPAVRRHLD